MSKYFITFGAGIFDNYINNKPANFYEAGKRLINEVNELQLFDETRLYSDHYLINDHIFWPKHANFINNNKRGYGYWIWKPYLIKKTMDTMKNGDILLYADSGCTLLKNKNNFNNLFKLVETDKIIGSFTYHSDLQFNKQDLIHYLEMDNSEHLNTKQHQATAIMFYICDETRKLVELWYDVCCNYHMIDDSKSILKNNSLCCGHRHDQSVFSLLTKKYNIYSNITLLNAIKLTKKRTG